jgi:hypothetical protein
MTMHATQRAFGTCLIALVASLASLACGGGTDTSLDLLPPAPSCVPGVQAACACPGGVLSIQVCLSDGTFGRCGCADGGGSGTAGADGAAGAGGVAGADGAAGAVPDAGAADASDGARADAGCARETDAAFCTRLGLSCGAVSAADNCGVSRTVASCGTCAGTGVACGGGGTPNVCGCAPETDLAFCARLG